MMLSASEDEETGERISRAESAGEAWRFPGTGIGTGDALAVTLEVEAIGALDVRESRSRDRPPEGGSSTKAPSRAVIKEGAGRARKCGGVVSSSYSTSEST